MTIAALNWAWQQECPNATSKLVLIALADKANDDGECWPGMDHIAEMVGISTRQVSTHLGTLEGSGLILRKRKRSALGRLGKNVYYVNSTSGSTLPVDQEKSTSGSPLPNGAGHQRKSDVDNQRKSTSSQRATHKEQPTPVGDGKPPFSTKLSAQLNTDHGWKPPAGVSHFQAFQALLTEALERRPENEHRSITMGIIADHADGSQVELTREARSHTARLVSNYPASEVLAAWNQAIVWGAGIGGKHAEDPLAMSKYAAKILGGKVKA
jgi:DNA-binding transcriptional ArsR family regulator